MTSVLHHLTTSPVFVATGANRSSCGITWERGRERRADRVAFCSGPLVVIGDPYTAQIEAVLVGHAPLSQVNAVAWINDDTRRLISCDSLGTILIWRYTGPEYELRATIASAHTESIGHVSTLPIPSGAFMAATSASDKCVRVWSDRILLDTIDCRVLPLCSAFWRYQDRTLLAVGGVDARIVLYRLDEGRFVEVASLEGHSDWVRDLDWTTGSERECVLASASLDRTIRIWSLDDAVQPRLDVTLEAVLDGHDHSVMNARWGPDLTLFSTSCDKTVMTWRLDGDAWVSMSQTGEVGGHNLACYTVAFSPDASMLLTNTYNGAFYLWSRDQHGPWHSCPIWTGHCSGVAGIVWGVDGDYLVSIGDEDQTTRVYAPWTQSPRAPLLSFYEFARPQVHGYDMSCICTVPGVQHRFVSAGQEKVLRVFDAPKPFLRDLHQLSGVALRPDEMKRAAGVYLPALGLSNKVMKGRRRLITDVVVPPEESVLALDTLWPEVAKLYGHGNYLFAACVSHSGMWLASGSTSRDRDNAAIILWRSVTWKETQRLYIHDLTVVQMAFSLDDRYLLSISRDRSVAISVCDEGGAGWRLSFKVPNAHSRVIWSCAWSTRDSFFVTGGRDKHVRAWAVNRADGTFAQVGMFTLATAVTAVAITDDDLLAVGGEDGGIQMWQGSQCGAEWRYVHTMPAATTHSGAVKQLCWQPRPTGQYPLLASCGPDHTVRIFSIADKT